MKFTIEISNNLSPDSKTCWDSACSIKGHCRITGEKLEFVGGGGDETGGCIYKRCKACLDAQKKADNK